jgi:uncharacterized protein YcaQ
MQSRLSWEQVNAFRLERHHLTDAKKPGLVDVCRNVAGIQAQVSTAAQQALSARVRNFSPEALQAELWEKRRIVKSSAMRQTLHLLPADEFGRYMRALRRCRVGPVRNIMGKFGITTEEADEVVQIILEALDGRALTQSEIRKALNPKTSPRVKRWMSKVWSAARPAAVEGLVCYGRERGNDVVFVRVDQWLPKQEEINELEAKKFVLRRFLSAYGPARVQDFSHWMGMSVKESKEVWDATANEMTEVSVDGESACVLRKDLGALKKAKLDDAVVHLLPGFDPYLLAHADKDHLVDPKHYKKVYLGFAYISPVVLVDGRIVGIWKQVKKGKRLRIEVQQFEKLSPAAREGVEASAQRLSVDGALPCEVAFQQ